MIPFSNPMVGVKTSAPPFSMSGSFETDNDGWTLIESTRANQQPRTGSFAISNNNSAGFSFKGISRTFFASQIFGLKIEVSCYVQSYLPETSTKIIRYQYGSNSFQTIATISGGMNYQLISGIIPASTPKQDLTIQILATSGTNLRASFDDWGILGRR